MTRLLCLMMLIPGMLSAQADSNDAKPGFLPGRIYVAGLLGTGALDLADVAYGARVEAAIISIPLAVLGFEASAEHWRFNGPYQSGTYDYSFTATGGTISGHFGVRGSRFDPSIGVGLGYLFANSKLTEANGLDRSTGLYPIARVSIRYFVSPLVAFGLDGGIGTSTIRFAFTLRPTRAAGHAGRAGPGNFGR